MRVTDAIFHITTRSAWQDAQPTRELRPSSLAGEGFIHCSARAQVVRVANRLFRAQRDLLLLELRDHAHLPIKWEDCYQAGECFPHLYAPLCCQDVAYVHKFEVGDDGLFSLPVALRTGLCVHHVALRTNDVESLSAFYQRVLELPLVHEGTRSHWLAMGQGAVLMIEARTEGEPSSDARDQHLLCWSVSDLPEVEQRLDQQGVAIEGRTAHTVYFRDPEGRRLGLSTHPLR